MTDLARRLQAMHDPDRLDEWGDPIPHPVAQDALAEIARLTAALADARGEADQPDIDTLARAMCVAMDGLPISDDEWRRARVQQKDKLRGGVKAVLAQLERGDHRTGGAT